VKIPELVASSVSPQLRSGIAAPQRPGVSINNISHSVSRESRNDSYGNPMITDRFTGLKPSRDRLFHNGRLYEANVDLRRRRSLTPRSTPALRAETTTGSSVAEVPEALLDVVGDIPTALCTTTAGRIAGMGLGAPNDSGAPGRRGRAPRPSAGT